MEQERPELASAGDLQNWNMHIYMQFMLKICIGMHNIC